MSAVHGSDPPEFEPWLMDHANGSLLTVVVDIQFMGSNAFCGRTAIHKQRFLTDAPLQNGVTRFTLFGFELQHVGQQQWLIQKDDSFVLPHPVHTAVPWTVIEACSGIGAVDIGYQTCGIRTSCFVEQNPKFCDWLKQHGREVVIQGDITENRTIQQVAQKVQGKHVLSAGVSCQPFSRLGDMRAQADTRSKSFPGALILGHYLQSMIIILECTPFVKECEWAQKLMQSYASQTGYTFCQTVLHLHVVWPAFRSRWWAIFAHPCLGGFSIPDLPSLEFCPSILAVMPRMLPMPSSQCDELELDRYELRQFHAYKAGISSFVINKCKALPTATHSWGSQAKPCLCGCRPSGFSTERLMDKGLHGVLHSLDGFVTSGDDTFHTMRHLHPQEVALLNGLPPDFVSPQEGFPLRLELAAIGQMGSPIQSCWIMANILFQMFTKGLLSNADHPRQVLWNLCKHILDSRDRVWKTEVKTIYQRIFEREIDSIHQPLIRVNLQEEESFTQQIRDAIPHIEAELALGPKNQHDPSVKLGKGKGGNTMKHFMQLGNNVVRESACMKNTPQKDVVPTDKVEQTFGCQQADESVAFEPESKAHRPIEKINEVKPQIEGLIPESFHENGGVPGFETCKRKHPENGDGANKRPKAEDHEVSPTLPWPKPAIEELSDRNDAKADVVWVGTSQEAFVPVRFHQSHVGQLCAAEAKLNDQPQHEIRAIDSMGQPLSPSKQIQPGSSILLQSAGEWNQDKCPIQKSCNPPDVEGLTRINALQHQKGWVAFDEMEFYLEALSTSQGVITCKPLQLNETPGAEFVLENWIDRNSELANVSGGYLKVYTAGFRNNHWFPIALHIREDQIEFHSTPQGILTLENLIRTVFGANDSQCTFHSMVIGEAFPADCGFQTFSWLVACSDEQTSCRPMTSVEAIKWRQQFAEALVASDRHHTKVHQLQLGGMMDSKTQTDLQRLLEQHGVHPQRSPTCVNQLVDALGVGSLRATLGAPRPWNDLKAKASACKPPIQLVLSEELKKVIDDRIRSGQPFGRKENKKQSKTKVERPIVILASQVVIPHSVFQQEGGQQLGQLQPHEINPSSRGVMVLNINDALPFFNLREAISSEGIGLLVLNHNDPRLPPHEIVRFPATCAGTQEPMLMTAALVQLGRKKVERQIPETKHRIEEVATVVIRASVYKDEFTTMPWEDFCSSPVKHLFTLDEFAGGGQAIIDVWDRQYLTKSFKKSKPETAEVFIVTIRITVEEGTKVINAGGKGGVYYEPRNASGRETHPDFGVVWLPKKNHGEVWIAKTTSPKQTWLARNGDRYGLRTALSDIESIHQLHRPEVAYLNGMQVQQYRVGPLPFGTTRQSLQQAIKTWGWSGRPGQPQGQTPDHTGVVWSILATSVPTHWVYNMEHGDVLITKHEGGKTPEHANKSGPIVASDRTLKHLSSSSSDASRMSQHSVSSDPVFDNDPWAKWQRPVTGASTAKSLSANQIATIEANVEKKIRESIQTGCADDSMEPAVDSRVSQLESKVQSMQESIDKMQFNIQSYQGQQQQHNAQVVSEITTIKTQVDQQSSSLKSMLDSKLEDQMNRIEALLCKRAKTNE